MNTAQENPQLPAGRNDAFWPSVIAAFLVLLSTAVGMVFRLGMTWHFISDGVTAIALLAVVWELQRQRQRTATRTAARIEELLKLLRSAAADASREQLQTIEAELQRLQTDLRGRATL